MRQLLRLLDSFLYRLGRALGAPASGRGDTGRDDPGRRATLAEFFAQVQGVVIVTDEPSRGFTYGAGFDPGPVDDSFLPRPSLEGIEFECRQRMKAVAAHQVRGFDSAKVHARMLALLDDALDLYNLAVQALED